MSIFRQADADGLRLRSVCCRFCLAPALPGTDLCHYHSSEEFRLVRQPQRAGYRFPAYRRARRAAIKRAGGRCEVCGRELERKLNGDVVCEAHHRDCDPTHNTAANLLIVCPACHLRAHRAGSGGM